MKIVNIRGWLKDFFVCLIFYLFFVVSIIVFIDLIYSFNCMVFEYFRYEKWYIGYGKCKMKLGVIENVVNL